MLSGYVRSGSYPESLMFFSSSLADGIQANVFVLASLMAACQRSGRMMEEGVQLHCLAAKFGLIYDVFVGTSFVHFYGAYGLVAEARKFFEEMPLRNVVSWTAMMVGYLNDYDLCGVIYLYQTLNREGVIGTENTFTAVISSCSLFGDEIVAHQVLGQVVKRAPLEGVSVANSLISMFGSFGKVEEARYVFNHMDDRDAISWNSIISATAQNGKWREALGCLNDMRSVHTAPNSTTFSILLNACGDFERLKWGKGIHGLVVKSGFSTDVCVFNTLLSMYSEAGRCRYAETLFHEMSEKDSISWNSMISCYARDENGAKALSTLAEMIGMNSEINYVTFTSALSACSGPDFLTHGRCVHALVILAGLQQDLVINNALITMYGLVNLMTDATKVFQRMPRRDVVSWNALIGFYAENEKYEDAFQAFTVMRQEGIPVNYITVVNVMAACLTSRHLSTLGMAIHAIAILKGLESFRHIQNSLISMYTRCGDYDASNCIFLQLENKDVVAWNAMMAANAHHGQSEEAIKHLIEMRAAEVSLDHFSFSAGLAAAANSALLEEGQQIHALAWKLGYATDVFVTNAAMDMYGKCGEMEDVLRISPKPMDRPRLTWNVLISVFARHGCFMKAKEAFEEMVKLGVNPDHVTFVSLLSACNHSGLVEEGLAYYAAMKSKFGVLQGIEHCVCIVDLLGRAGRVAEAEGFVNTMPVAPNDHVWRSLLAASKVHGDVDLGRRAAERLIELDPLDDSAYVLLSNVCATSRRWDEVERIRRQMGSLRKKPACSWVKLKDGGSSFKMGDTSHPQTEQIYGKLAELKKKIKEAGYIPDTSFVLRDTDEEQKESNLWNHSERLALAFALISTPEGSTVKVYKNLRVCGDCHTVYKFVSKVVERKIVLRDPFRFHHFSGGECSCSDYW